MLALLSIPVPLKATGLGARLFAFVNLGGLGDYKDLASNLPTSNLHRSGDDVRGGGGGRRPFFGDIRASVGGGVAIPLGGVARVVSMSYLSYHTTHVIHIYCYILRTHVIHIYSLYVYSSVCVYIHITKFYLWHTYYISHIIYYILYTVLTLIYYTIYCTMLYTVGDDLFDASV